MAKVRRRGKSFVLDYRIDGIRDRVTLDDRTEAEELCEKFNALKRAKRTAEFAKLLSARQTLLDAEIKLTGKTLAEAMNEYSKTCSKLKSHQTQRNEAGDFKKLFEFLRDEREVHFLREVTTQMLEEYQVNLLSKVSASTVNRRFNGFKNFFNKCVEWDYLDKSPARFIKHKRENPNPRKTLKDKETTRIAEKLPPYLRRPFLILAHDGPRPGEVVSPRVRDYNPEDKTLIVYSGKGAENSRIVLLSENSNSIIAEILSERENLKPGDFIFLNQRKRQLRPAVLTKAVREVRRKLGIEEGKTPYGLRHTFATKLARMDVAQEKTKKLMGHSSGRTTEKYYKLEQEDLRNTVKDIAKVFDFGTGKELEAVTESHKIG